MFSSRKSKSHEESQISLHRTLTARWRALPNLLIPGFPRCGSTSLYRYLVNHPSVASTIWKEVHYFNKNTNLERGENWYRSHFPLQSTLRLIQLRTQTPTYAVDATPLYSHREKHVEAMASLLPEAKLILLMRNPTRRAYSNHQNALQKNRKNLKSFDETVDREISWIQEIGVDAALKVTKSKGWKPSNFLLRGIYLPQIEFVLQHYPKEQVLLIRSEDLFEDTQGTFEKILTCLGLPPCPLPSKPQKNKLTYTDPMSKETETRLQDFFQPYNEALYKAIGRDLEWERKT